MKLHDLSPAEGSRKPRTRVGRGIAAGKGKTAGRGTKGQKSRTGGTIQPWFEGGQTPIHVRIPKLRGFRNLFRVEYEVVNVGRISALAETGVLDAPQIEGADETAAATETSKPGKPAPVTVTPDILAAAGLIRTLDKPLKVLGQGDVTRPLFIMADAFSASARMKIEAVGGTALVLEVPGTKSKPESPAEAASEAAPEAEPKPASKAKAKPAPKAMAEAKPEPKAKAEPKAKPAPKAVTPKPGPEPKAGSRAKPEPEAASETVTQQTPADEAGSEA